MPSANQCIPFLVYLLQASLQPGEVLSFHQFDRQKLCYNSFADWPKAKWQKATDSRLILRWLLQWMAMRQWQDHPDDQLRDLLDLQFEALRCIDLFFAELYTHGVFIPGPDAKRLAELGLTFMKLTQACIRICTNPERPLNRFKQQPKAHMLFHCFSTMMMEAMTAGFALNPLVECCQLPEDLIGKVCRLSRKVESRRVSLRTLQSVLVNAAQSWQRSFSYDD